MSFSLANKAAMITGGCSGIGLAIARRFLQAGAQVMIVDRAADGQDVATSLGAAFVRADVSADRELEAAFCEARARFGEVHILINSAGIQPLGIGFAELTEALLARTFAVNVQGTALAIKHAATMLASSGRVINIASFTGMIGAPRAAAYGPSKAAVIHLTKLAAIELAPRRITVNAISPGTIRTPAVTDIPNNPEIAFIERRTPLGRLGEPDEVAALAQFLASDEAGYLTGQNIALDGGLTAGWMEHDVIPPANFQNGAWVD